MYFALRKKRRRIAEDFIFNIFLNKLDFTTQFLKKIITLLFVVFLKFFFPHHQTQHMFLFLKKIKNPGKNITKIIVCIAWELVKT